MTVKIIDITITSKTTYWTMGEWAIMYSPKRSLNGLHNIYASTVHTASKHKYIIL